MELRHLRYFIAVAEEQNVTRAAARLHVSQPPLTRQIHDLEDELSFALFDRTGKALRLTDAGRVFLGEAKAVLLRLDAAVDSARAVAVGGAGELHVGYAPSPTAGILPAALRAFEQRFPKVRVVLHDQSSPEMLAGLRDGSLHVALMMQPPKAAARCMLFEPLGSHAMVVAVPPGHPLAKRRTVSFADVVAEPVVALGRKEFPDYHAFLARIMGAHYRKLRLAQECDSGMSLVAAVAAGKGAAITIATLAEMGGGRVRFVPLTPPPPRAVVGAAWLDEPFNPLTAAFLDAVRAVEMKNKAQPDHLRRS